MKEWYKTTMNIHFHTEKDAQAFVHQLDTAERLWPIMVREPPLFDAGES